MKTRTASIGYTSYNTTSATAAMAMGSGWAQDDAVWGSFGHGAAGAMSYYSSTAGGSTLFASSAVPGATCSSPSACLSNYTWTQLHRIRLMLFAGCDTADNGKVGSTYDGNLLKYAYNGRGVDSAVGFAGLIYWPPMEVWTDQFFAGAYYGDTVTQASNRAKAAVLSYYGSYQGTDTVVIYGGGTYLSPPNYGQ